MSYLLQLVSVSLKATLWTWLARAQLVRAYPTESTTSDTGQHWPLIASTGTRYWRIYYGGILRPHYMFERGPFKRCPLNK